MAVVSQSQLVDPFRIVKQIERVVNGPSVSTPSPNILHFADVGLLYFLKNKQSLILSLISQLNLATEEALLPLKSLLEFSNFVVGGLIVEAERVDEAVIELKKEISEVGNNLRNHDLELQHKRRYVGSTVVQTIAHHYSTRINVPMRESTKHSDQLADRDNIQLSKFADAIQSHRRLLHLKQKQLKALIAIQRLLRGSSEQIPSVEADAIVQDLGILPTFRKANHRIRDILFDVPSKDDLKAVHSLLEFIMYLDCGMTAAADDLGACALNIQKKFVAEETRGHVLHLERREAAHKELSATALRQNEELGRGVLQRVDANDSHLGVSRAPPMPVAHDAEMEDFLHYYCS